MPDFNSWSSVSLVLLGVLVGVLSAIVVAFCTVWLTQTIVDKTAPTSAARPVRQPVVPPAPETGPGPEDDAPHLVRRAIEHQPVTRLREAVGPELAKIRTNTAPMQAPVRVSQAAYTPTVTVRPGRTTPIYRYYVDGWDGAFNSIREVLTRAFPDEKSLDPKHAMWDKLPKAIRDHIQREEIKEL